MIYDIYYSIFYVRTKQFLNNLYILYYKKKYYLIIVNFSKINQNFYVKIIINISCDKFDAISSQMAHFFILQRKHLETKKISSRTKKSIKKKKGIKKPRWKENE